MTLIRRICAGLLALLVAALTSCSVDGSAIPVQGIRQVDDRGVRLPFTTKHSQRWNTANDGTEYEPCTGVQLRDLSRLNIDARSVRDAAKTNGQTLRGCIWTYEETGTDIPPSISQTVGNGKGLDAAKARRSGPQDSWLDDILIASRRVGIHVYSFEGYCATYVESGTATVISTASHSGTHPLNREQLCERAIAFTKATIDRMPE
ncbi:DUF3558 family protein [Gordonia malaquae]|jgi:hypothetical protein|uniref:DUF3558 family protein n=1 Tax=Gordonia malaquae TaxID=410332 RepID=UPI003AFA9C7C